MPFQQRLTAVLVADTDVSSDVAANLPAVGVEVVVAQPRRARRVGGDR